MALLPLSESLRTVEAAIAAGHPDLALAQCQEVQSRYPRALAVQRVLGEIYLAQRKPREALAALGRALEGDPEDARACCARAIVHQMHGDSLAALAWYRRACDIRPDDAVLRVTYFELATHLGQPSYHPTRTGLARLYLRGDLLTHAIREWEQLIVDNPDALDAQVGLAEALWRAGRLQVAAERCRRTLANAPSCVKPLLLLAIIQHDGGNDDETTRLIQRAADLDPDQRIGQTLFADRLAVDRAVRGLLLDALRTPPQPPAEAAASALGQDAAAARPSISRPLVTSRKLGASAGDRAAASILTGPLGPAPRAAALPPEFRSMFNEAEYMIWGPDEQARARAASIPGTSGVALAPARVAAFVPPALAAQGNALDDTEIRAAINWVHWLQAQGAVAHAPTRERPQPAGRDPLPPRQTGPLPPPTPEALRSMFAELAPDGSSHPPRVVEADGLPTSADSSAATNAAPRTLGEGLRDDTTAAIDAQSSAPSAPQWSDAHARATGWVSAGGLPMDMARLADEEVVTAAVPAVPGARDATSGPLGHDATLNAADHPTPGSTLEEMQRQFAASGFQTMEPRPGILAALGTNGGSASHDTSTPDAASAPDDATAAETSQPSPDDYPARLERARQRRAAGELRDSLTEYRAVLKNAPDLLEEVISELQQCIAAAPAQPEPHRLLGDARIRQGDYLGALEAYNHAVALGQSQEG